MAVAFVIPNESLAPFPIQAEPDQFDLGALTEALQASGVVSGCQVTDGALLKTNVASGVFKYLNVLKNLTGGPLTHNPAHATLNRFDLICARVDTLVPEIVQGGSAAEPEFPNWINGNRVLLAACYIPAAVTEMTADMIIDKRVILLPDTNFGSTLSQIDIGDAQVAGASGLSADALHQHSFPAPSPGYAVQVGIAGADGVSTIPARADHAHKHGPGHLPDDHHPQAHSHTGADSSGTVAHSSLTGSAAGDDHTQYVLRSILTTDGDLPFRSGGVWTRLGIGGATDVLGVSGGLPAWVPASGLASGTLDQAYDFGGAGAGRTINAHDGSVLIQSSEADVAPNLEIRRASGDVAKAALHIGVTGESSPRFEARADGSLRWGAGSSLDVVLERVAAANLGLAAGHIFHVDGLQARSGGVIDVHDELSIRDFLHFNDAGETISSGAITVSNTYFYIDTELAAASDELDTITVSPLPLEGTIIVFRAANTGRTVIVKHGTGNIQCVTGADITLDDDTKWCIGIRRQSDSMWLVGQVGAGSGSGGSGHTIRENGVDQTARTGLNFVDTDAGAGLITDDVGGDETEVNLQLYALLSGRSGGQTLIGGTLTTQNLVLRANAADTTSGIVSILDNVRLASGKSIQDSGGTARYTPSTTGPESTLTGNVFITGNLGVVSTPGSSLIRAVTSPAGTGSSIDVLTGQILYQNASSGTINLRGVTGEIQVVAGNYQGASVGYLRGLEFRAVYAAGVASTVAYSPSATLNGSHDGTTTTIAYTSAGDPFTVNDVIKIDSELMLVTAIDTGANNLTVTRGYLNSYPVQHNNATAITNSTAGQPPTQSNDLLGIQIIATGGQQTAHPTSAGKYGGLFVQVQNMPRTADAFGVRVEWSHQVQNRAGTVSIPSVTSFVSAPQSFGSGASFDLVVTDFYHYRAIDPLIYVGTNSLPTNLYGLHIGAMARGTNRYGVYVTEPTAGSATIARPLELQNILQARAPLESARAANTTQVWLYEGTGPTLRRVQWVDPGVGGVNFAGGERVMVLV